MKNDHTASRDNMESTDRHCGLRGVPIGSPVIPLLLALPPVFLLLSCVDSSEVEAPDGVKTSTSSQEVDGECWAVTTCQYEQVQCHGYRKCEVFDDGSGDPRSHYLQNLSNTNTFGHADQGYFAVRNVPGNNTVRCDGIPTSCPKYPMSATITMSNYSAADGPWPRTVPVGQTFMVQFANQTAYTLVPALQLWSVSYGSVVDPNYVGLVIVGRDAGGEQL
jgi:hypothetical protein